MKNTKLAIVLAALTTSAGFVLAQNKDFVKEGIPVPPTPPDALIAPTATEPVSPPGVRLPARKNQLKQAERPLPTTPKPIAIAQARGGEASGRSFARTLGGAGSRNGSAGRALIIPKDAGDVKGFAEMEEDLNVMAYILDKALSSDEKSPRAMGIAVFGRISGGSASPQNLYIEGFGAILFANVNYPLLPPPTKEKDTEPREKTSNEWEEARREITQPTPPTPPDSFAMFDEGFGGGGGFGAQATAAYDGERVEELKKDLVSALKNAANIRKLKADETVIVVVSAPGPSAGTTPRAGTPAPTVDRRSKEYQAELEHYQAMVEGFHGSGRAATGASTKLVLRTRKADSEAFQNSKLNFDEFRKKVSVMIY